MLTQYRVVQLAWRKAFEKWQDAKYEAEIFGGDAAKQRIAEEAYIEYCDLCGLVQYPEKLNNLTLGVFETND